MSAGFRSESSRASPTTRQCPATACRRRTCCDLWKAEAAESFDFDAFNVGDYYGAVNEKVKSETISKVLYPNDEPDAGKELRLAQQYFFVSCSLQDMVRLTLVQQKTLAEFHVYWAAAVERHASPRLPSPS